MPTKDNLHISSFKSKAKSLHKFVRSGDRVALKRIRPYFKETGDFKLTQAQLVIARESNCTSWRALTGKDDWVSCTFCKKWQYDVAKVIAVPDVHVCNECVEMCNEIIKNAEAQAS